MKVANPLVISREQFLATGAKAKDFDAADRFDGNPGDGKLDVTAYAAKVEKDIACHGVHADRSFSDGVLGLRTAAYAAKVKNLPTKDLFIKAEALVEGARSAGFGRYPSC